MKNHWCNTIPVATSLCKNLVFQCVKELMFNLSFYSRSLLDDIPCSFRTWHSHSSPLLLLFVKVGDIVSIAEVEIIESGKKKTFWNIDRMPLCSLSVLTEQANGFQVWWGDVLMVPYGTKTCELLKKNPHSTISVLLLD